jgi:ElaB/YqjD/DUF883 family membrane-anchored ribosome-binding protein
LPDDAVIARNTLDWGAEQMPADTAADTASKIAADVAAQTEKSLADLARRAEAAIKEGLAELKERSRDYADVAGDHFETAQQYVTDRVQERPLAATLTALGVGVLIGFMLAGGRRQ